MPKRYRERGLRLVLLKPQAGDALDKGRRHGIIAIQRNRAEEADTCGPVGGRPVGKRPAGEKMSAKAIPYNIGFVSFEQVDPALSRLGSHHVPFESACERKQKPPTSLSGPLKRAVRV